MSKRQIFLRVFNLSSSEQLSIDCLHVVSFGLMGDYCNFKHFSVIWGLPNLLGERSL
jgi:hypothetical protein